MTDNERDKRKRGRPPTRSSELLLYFVWVKVREEIAYRGAPNALQACGQILKRFGDRGIRIEQPAGLKTIVIGNAQTLHRRYRAAEAARAGSLDFEAKCAAWDAQAAQYWPGVVARRAYWRSLIDSAKRGFPASVENYVQIDASATKAAEGAKSAAPRLARPRKNRV